MKPIVTTCSKGKCFRYALLTSAVVTLPNVHDAKLQNKIEIHNKSYNET